MAVNLSFIGGAGWQFLDNNGNPLSGGKIYTYAAGTTNPLATYTSRTGLIANTNPIILDAAGRTPEQIWSTEGLLYKYVVADSSDNVIRTWDNIGGSVVASDLAQDLADTSNNAKGDALIGFKQSNSSGFLTNAVARTVNDKLQEFVSVLDFGADPTGVADSTAAFTAAIATNRAVFVPSGFYKVTDVELTDGTRIVGERGGGNSNAGTIILVGTNNAAAFVNTESALGVLYDIQISDLQIRAAGGVTGAKGFYQVNKGAYTAHPIFYNVETWGDLEVSYDGFFIFAVWNNCRDSFYGTAPVGQTHQGIRCIPATYGQTYQANLNKVFCCQFFRSSATNAAVEIEYGFDWTFDGCDFEANATRALYIRGVYGVKIMNTWFEINNADYVIFCEASPSPNAQGTRPVSIDNCHFYLQGTTTAAIFAGSASTFGVANTVFTSIPSAVVLANENPQYLYNNTVLTGAGASAFLTGFKATQTAQILGANTELTASTKASPYFANANLLPIGPSGLGASNFTVNSSGTPTGAITNVASGIGLAGQAIQWTLSDSQNWVYYQIPAKIIPILQGKPVTLTVGGYGNGSIPDGANAQIWEDVVPSFSNGSAGTVNRLLDVSDASLQVASTTSTIGASTTTLYVGFRVGGANPNDEIFIETMTLYVGEIAPDVPNLH